ncbi:MAG: type I-C CRISPR-associated endonuclease Cas1c [Pseudomonadota bacterium]
MKRHLNTLYITTDGAWLSKDGENVVVSSEGQEIGRVPVHTIGGIIGFGRVLMSPQLMGHCAENDIGMSFLSENGRFLARVVGPQSGNVLLRREQYRRADDETATAMLVRSFIAGKTINKRTVLRRALRDHGASMDATVRARLETSADRLTAIARKTANRSILTDELRGLEGEAGHVYFAVFDNLIRSDKDVFKFQGRSRRPPLDRVNAVLSFVYTLLAHDVRSALECVGLDPAVGFLHRDRPGRSSLALDIMEEFRPFFADRLVLSLINRRQLGAKDFREFENGAVLLTDDGRKTVLVAYQERKREELTHPFIEEKVTVGLSWHVQAQLLARHLRGDLDGYPPFVWK